MRIFQILFYTLLFMANVQAMDEENPQMASIKAIPMDAMMYEDAKNEGWSPKIMSNRVLWIERKNREYYERYHYDTLFLRQFPNHVHMEYESPIINNYNFALPQGGVYSLNFQDHSPMLNHVHMECERQIINNYNFVLPQEGIYSINLQDPPVKKQRLERSKKPLQPGLCTNCSKTESSLWRVFKTSEDYVSVCNGCGIRAQKGKFCQYCYYIYYDADIFRNADWVKCKYCDKHAHRACFQKCGNKKAVYRCQSCSRSHR